MSRLVLTRRPGLPFRRGLGQMVPLRLTDAFTWPSCKVCPARPMPLLGPWSPSLIFGVLLRVGLVTDIFVLPMGDSPEPMDICALMAHLLGDLPLYQKSNVSQKAKACCHVVHVRLCISRKFIRQARASFSRAEASFC